MPENTTTKDKTITTNKITPNMLTADKIQSILPGQQPEPPKSSLAITAALLLIIGFALITLGLFIPVVLLPLAVLGGSTILSANVVAILSLRELS
jgi:hypothetical protein